jgi:TPR repeat protein
MDTGSTAPPAAVRRASLEQGEDPTSSVVRWKKESAHGDSAAMYNLGLSYEMGQGVPKDKGEAFKWFLRSAINGKVKSCGPLCLRMSGRVLQR